jgi:hypothetical protein
MSKVKSAVLGTLALAATAGLGGCYSVDGHVTWQPSGVPHHDHPYQQWWNYQFVYFPQQQVYFEPYTEEYFWFRNGQWERGTELPADISVDPTQGRIVKLQHQDPYLQHETVLQWSWPYNHPAGGALDDVHRSDEAVALMEKRRIWRESGLVGDQADWWQTQWTEANEPTDSDEASSQEIEIIGSLDENEDVSIDQSPSTGEMVSGVDN